jgi:hypothetical protein
MDKARSTFFNLSKELKMSKIFGLFVGALLGFTALTASAGSIPYNVIGTQAPANFFVASADGKITAYFYATDAGYNSEIGLRVNGVSTGIYGLWNHGSTHGDSLVLGNVNAGDILEFELKVLSTSSSWFSIAGDNSDHKNHTYSTDFAGDAWIPVGTYVAFEDLPGLGDLDYNDHQFVFTNVSNTSVSEPAGLGLLVLGLAAIGFTRKRTAS